MSRVVLGIAGALSAGFLLAVQASRGPAPAPESGPVLLAAPALDAPRRPAGPNLAQARGWCESLRALDGLRQAGHLTLRELDLRFQGTRRPVARQNLIFHVALSLPWEEACPWLERVAAGSDPDDAEDALCALAFSGEPAALAEFEAAPAESRAFPLVDRHEDHELRGRLGERAILRSYRALEVADRAPYFKMTAHLVRVRWQAHPRATHDGAQAAYGREGSREAPSRLRSRLWRAWLGRWPRHPGGDDVALRIARDLLARQRALPAARWFSRATLLPDQDVTLGALAGLLGLAEVALSEAQLDELIEWARAERSNHGLLRYVRLRRRVAREGVAAVCSWLEAESERAPDTLIARAWRARWAEPEPRGLTSGVAPLTTADPLRRLEGARISARQSQAAQEREVPRTVESWWSFGNWGQWSERGRLDPWPEAVDLDPQGLARQLRCWATLAELERRERSLAGSDPAGAADLRYKRAALLFHERRVFYPLYGGCLRSRTLPLAAEAALPSAEWSARLAELERDTRSVRHALHIFEGLAEVEWPGRDRALFSAGLACRRLLHREDWREPGEREEVIRVLVAHFERLTRELPESPLVKDARRAAAWWRRAHAYAFSSR